MITTTVVDPLCLKDITINVYSFATLYDLIIIPLTGWIIYENCLFRVLDGAGSFQTSQTKVRRYGKHNLRYILHFNALYTA